MNTDIYKGPFGVDLDDIDPKLRPASQMRKGLDQEAIHAYAESFNEMPPVTLVHDKTTGLHWLVDGCHTIHAARERGLTVIQARVRNGDYLDAFREASRANGTHGVRITNADKRHRVEEALRNPLISGHSTRAIADICAVHHQTIVNLRPEPQVSNLDTSTVTGKDGKQYPAKPRKPRKPKPKPEPQPEQPTSEPEPEPEPTASEPEEPETPPEPTPAPKPNGKPRGKAPEKPTPQPEPTQTSKSTQEAPVSRETSGQTSATAEPVDWDERWVRTEKLIVNECEGWDMEARAYFAAELLGLALRLRDIYCPNLVVQIDDPTN
jgi:hypothetical protein